MTTETKILNSDENSGAQKISIEMSNSNTQVTISESDKILLQINTAKEEDACFNVSINSNVKSINVNHRDNDKDNMHEFYCLENERIFFNQMSDNASEKDKLLAVVSGIFIAASATILNIKVISSIGFTLLILALVCFALSLGFSLFGFNVALKSSAIEYKLFCKGLNKPEKRISYEKFTKKLEKIRKKYKSEILDKIAISACCIGIFLFVCFIINLSLK